jgi:hypothetical protein
MFGCFIGEGWFSTRNFVETVRQLLSVRPTDRFSVKNHLAAQEGARWQPYARNLPKRNKRI